jgi:SAM-dependent methyltransferase
MATSPYDNIADLYDTFVQTTLDIPFFLEAARETQGEALDLMAGTGRVSLPLAEAGLRMACVDSSAEMLAVLREKLDTRGLTADLHTMDVRSLALGKMFGLILLPFHAFAELPTPDDQRQALKAIYAHLAEGGRFICALHNPAVRLKSADGLLHLIGKFPNGGGRLLVWILQTYRPESQRVEISEFFEEYDAEGRMTARRMMEMQVSFIERAAFEEATSPFMIWVLGR